MRTLGMIRAFRTKHFTLRARAVEDEWVDLSWDDDGSVTEGLNDGTLNYFGVIVEVSHRQTGAILGKDSLWGCVERNYTDFRKSGYFRDLVSEACSNARNALADLKAIKLND